MLRCLSIIGHGHPAQSSASTTRHTEHNMEDDVGFGSPVAAAVVPHTPPLATPSAAAAAGDDDDSASGGAFTFGCSAAQVFAR